MTSREGLDAEYVWFRIEYQKRGTAHAHGCARLKSDPGLVQLGEKVFAGKVAQRILQNSGRVDSNTFSTEGFFTAEDIAQDLWDDDMAEGAEEEESAEDEPMASNRDVAPSN